jgi:5-methylcytosine-specific restriction endonuclease McrA
VSELGECHYCTRQLDHDTFSWDHLLPLCRGGDNRADNKVRACRRCNNRKSCLTDEEYLSVKEDNKARKRLITEVLRQLSQANLSTG